VYSRKNNELQAHQIADSLSPVFTQEFQSIAKASGWPTHLINAIQVVVHPDTSIALEYPNELQQEIEDLEYGPEFGVANTAIRAFMYRCEATLQSYLTLPIPDMIAEVL
jgi:hypothetical protein